MINQPPNHHLAELNIGRLVAPTDDPRVAEFMGNLDRINRLGKRMPGFVWMMEGSGEPGTGNTENSIGDDPQFVANLTVWESVETLGAFVWDTVHRRFYARRREWFETGAEAPDQVRGSGRALAQAADPLPEGGGAADPVRDRHFVMWWVPAGHRPTIEEGMARLADLEANGSTDAAFGWDHVDPVWQAKRCGMAAE